MLLRAKVMGIKSFRALTKALHFRVLILCKQEELTDVCRKIHGLATAFLNRHKGSGRMRKSARKLPVEKPAFVSLTY